MKTQPATIDAYLGSVSDETRAALEKLRKTIGSAAPKAEECISYGIPAFRLNGMLVASFSEDVHEPIAEADEQKSFYTHFICH